MTVAVVIPFQAGCPQRERALGFVAGSYAATHPRWEVVEAPAASAGDWCKATAINPAIEASSAKIIIQADADCWADDLADAVAAVEAGAAWAVPHLLVHRLSEQGTEAVLAGEDWRDQPLAQNPYRGILGGGFVVTRRDVLLAAPLDPRFKGWGGEDEAHADALNALFGPPWRGSADLIHLWHPPQQRMTRRKGSYESWALRCRYRNCKDDPAAMAALIEESRDTSPALEHSGDRHPAAVG